MARLVAMLEWLAWLTLTMSLDFVVSEVHRTDEIAVESGESLSDLKNTVQLLREQLDALIHHRQEDYNSLESNLKSIMEKNTELTVLRNQVGELRKEVTALRGGSGNEAKNEKLRIKWLGTAVTELRNELAEVLGTRNASEELAQRSGMHSELVLLKGDVAQLARGIRDLGGRLTRIEAALGTIRLDIFSVKERAGQLTRTCADVTSQLSTVQIEVKSLRCHNNEEAINNDQSTRNRATNGVNEESKNYERRSREPGRRISRVDNIGKYHRKRYSLGDADSGGPSVQERIAYLEHKVAMVARKRGIIEKRVVYENAGEEFQSRLDKLEKTEREIEIRVSNVTRDVGDAVGRIDESIIGLLESVENIEERSERSKSEGKREIARLELNAAQKYAELSLTREQLDNLRRTVQALSVSASKLQEKSDLQGENIEKIMRESKVNRGNDVISREVKGSNSLSNDYDLPPNDQGWIAVARRIDGSMDFDRTWDEYAAGFGSSLHGEFWLGNELLHRYTKENCTALRIDLVDTNGAHWRAEYEHFYVGSASDGAYRLEISGYTGNATDAFSYQNGMSFSARDRDVDTSSADCAANYQGGWWFSNCQHANLNGRYSLGLTWYRTDTAQWMPVASSVMSIQRRRDSSGFC